MTSPVGSPENDFEGDRVRILDLDRPIYRAKPTPQTDHGRKRCPGRFPTPKRTGKLGGFPWRLPLSLCLDSRPRSGTRRRAGAGDVSRGPAGLGELRRTVERRTWLVGILKHRIIDHLRRTTRERAVSGESSSQPIDDPAFDVRGRWRAMPDSWRGDPSSVLETREFWDVFGVCLSRLPRGLADAFFLREVDGLSAEETCELLQISADNLWTRSIAPGCCCAIACNRTGRGNTPTDTKAELTHATSMPRLALAMAQPPLPDSPPHLGGTRPSLFTTQEVRPPDSPSFVRRLPTIRPTGPFSPRCIQRLSHRLDHDDSHLPGPDLPRRLDSGSRACSESKLT